MKTDAYFEGLEVSHYRTAVGMLENHYNNCITLYVSYVKE